MSFYSTKLRRKVKVTEPEVVHDISKNGSYYIMAVYPNMHPDTKGFDEHWDGEFHYITKFVKKEEALRFPKYQSYDDFKGFTDTIRDWWNGK